jgi:hypothetical protein
LSPLTNNLSHLRAFWCWLLWLTFFNELLCRFLISVPSGYPLFFLLDILNHIFPLRVTVAFQTKKCFFPNLDKRTLLTQALKRTRVLFPLNNILFCHCCSSTTYLNPMLYLRLKITILSVFHLINRIFLLVGWDGCFVKRLLCKLKLSLVHNINKLT